MFSNSHFKAAKFFFAAFFIFIIFSLDVFAVEDGFTEVKIKFYSAALPTTLPKSFSVNLIYEPQRHIPFFNGRNKASGFGGTLPGIPSSSGNWTPKQIVTEVAGKPLQIHGDQLLLIVKTELFGISSYRLKAIQLNSELVSRTFYFKDKTSDKAVSFGYSNKTNAGDEPSQLGAIYATVESNDLSFDPYYENKDLDHQYVQCDSSLCVLKEKIYLPEVIVESMSSLISATNDELRSQKALLQNRKTTASGFFKAPFNFKECVVSRYQMKRTRKIEVNCANKNSYGDNKQKAQVKYTLFDNQLVSVSRYFVGSFSKSSDETLLWWNGELTYWSLDQDLVGKSKKVWSLYSDSKVKKSVNVQPFLDEALRYWRL